MKSHPAANLFPLLTGKEYKTFKADIAENGLLESIWTCDEMILDGRNRYRACGELGIDPKFKKYKGSVPTAFAWSMNGQRRQLTKSQLAAIAVKMLPVLQKEAEKRMLAGKSDPTPKSAEGGGEATKQAANIVGIGNSVVKQAKHLQDNNPKLLDEVVAGEISVNEAYKKSKAAQKPKKRKKAERPNTASRSNGKASYNPSTEETEDEQKHRLELSQACHVLGRAKISKDQLIKRMAPQIRARLQKAIFNLHRWSQ